MRVHHIAFSVSNLEKSVKFYKEMFGFKEVQKFTKPGWTGEAMIMELNDMRIELFCFSDKIDKKDDYMDFKVIGIKHMSIEVEDVVKAHEELKAKGADIDEPMDGTTCTKWCFVRDPDGLPIELYQK